MTRQCPFRRPVESHLFTGVSAKRITKVCAVMQALPGVMDDFIANNAEVIAASGHVLESTVAQVFLDNT